jgi:hypothetical protein
MLYSILESKSLRGEVGELLVAQVLRKKGFYLYRPAKLLAKIKSLELPETYEVEFLRKHSKTMDFFAIFPRDHCIDSREVVCQLFSGYGLKKYVV